MLYIDISYIKRFQVISSNYDSKHVCFPSKNALYQSKLKAVCLGAVCPPVPRAGLLAVCELGNTFSLLRV